MYISCVQYLAAGGTAYLVAVVLCIAKLLADNNIFL